MGLDMYLFAKNEDNEKRLRLDTGGRLMQYINGLSIIFKMGAMIVKIIKLG